MSIDNTGRYIRCDGKECEEVALAPIALNPSLGVSAAGLPSAAGWLFITGSGAGRHFCPQCALLPLSEIVGGDTDLRE